MGSGLPRSAAVESQNGIRSGLTDDLESRNRQRAISLDGIEGRHANQQAPGIAAVEIYERIGSRQGTARDRIWSDDSRVVGHLQVDRAETRRGHRRDRHVNGATHSSLDVGDAKGHRRRERGQRGQNQSEQRHRQWNSRPSSTRHFHQSPRRSHFLNARCRMITASRESTTPLRSISMICFDGRS